MNKLSIGWTFVVLVMVGVIATLSVNTCTILSANRQLRKVQTKHLEVISAYRQYYKISEKLFDEVEDSVGEYVFDTDKGCDYLDARKKIKDID